jgi:flagellar biosynthetic protein FlhB
MDFDDGQDRTEAATPRRRQEARKKGQVAYSGDLSGAVLLLTCVSVLWLGGKLLGRLMLDVVGSELLRCWRPQGETLLVGNLAETVFTQGLYLAGAVMVAAAGSALLVGVMQAGVYWTTRPLAVDWGRLSPARGWSRLFSSRSAVRGGFAILKAALLASVAAWVLYARAGQISLAGHGTLGQAALIAWDLTMVLGMGLAAVMALLGLADYLFQRWRLEQELRMTRREVREELRQQEGDPQLRARIRKLQRETAQRQMLREVPQATVVLTNPTHFAVALRYERGQTEAPQVVAKGTGRLARRIAEIAGEHGVPVLQRKSLTRALYHTVEVGQEIPLEFYQALAEILAYVYRQRAA